MMKMINLVYKLNFSMSNSEILGPNYIPPPELATFIDF